MASGRVVLPLLAARGRRLWWDARVLVSGRVALPLLAAQVRQRLWAVLVQALQCGAVVLLRAAKGGAVVVLLRAATGVVVLPLPASVPRADSRAQMDTEARELSFCAVVPRRANAELRPSESVLRWLVVRLRSVRSTAGRAPRVSGALALLVEVSPTPHARTVAARRLVRAMKSDQKALQRVAAPPSAADCYAESRPTQLRSRHSAATAHAVRSTARTPRARTPRCARNPHRAPQSSPVASARNAAPRAPASRDNESHHWARAN